VVTVSAHRFRQQPMAPEGVVEPFGGQDVERLAQREQEMHRRGAGVLLVVLRPVALGPVPIRRAQAGTLVRGAGTVADRDERQAGRRHQPLLRRRHRDIDAPGIHLERHAAERRYRIDHQQRGMAGGLDGAADRFQIVARAGGGVDLHHHDRLDGMLGVAAQPRFNLIGADRAAPVALQHLDVAAHRAGGVAPADREPAAFQHQHLVAARQHVADHRLPGAVTVGDVDVGLALGGEQPAEVGKKPLAERHHLLRVDVERRAMHRLQHLVGHGGRARNRQEFPSGADGHDAGPFG
jgi:hypothetical protein